MSERKSAQEQIRRQQVHPKLVELVDKSISPQDRNLSDPSGVIINAGLIPFYQDMRSYDECLEQIIIAMADQLDTTAKLLTEKIILNCDPQMIMPMSPSPAEHPKPKMRYDFPQPKIEKL